MLHAFSGASVGFKPSRTSNAGADLKQQALAEDARPNFKALLSALLLVVHKHLCGSRKRRAKGHWGLRPLYRAVFACGWCMS